MKTGVQTPKRQEVRKDGKPMTSWTFRLYLTETVGKFFCGKGSEQAKWCCLV
jgi:hypothetical protein